MRHNGFLVVCLHAFLYFMFVGGALFTHGTVVLLVPQEVEDGYAEECGWVSDVPVADSSHCGQGGQ